MTTIIAEDKPAGTTQIHCPVCRQRDIPAQIIEHIEKVTEYLVVQVNTYTTWWVVCTGCKTRLYSKVSGIELQQRTADQLVGVVVPRVSLVRQFFAVVSVLLSIAPFMGLCIGIIAYLLNRKSPGWPRIASKIGLGITGLVHVAILLMFVSVALSARK
jgi:hypothetical protein